MKDTPSAFSERVAGIACGHGYREHDVFETFWSDFSQAIDRSWRRNATVCTYICKMARLVTKPLTLFSVVLGVVHCVESLYHSDW